jgi:hypothetical protein
MGNPGSLCFRLAIPVEYTSDKGLKVCPLLTESFPWNGQFCSHLTAQAGLQEVTRIRGRALEGLCGLCGPGDDSWVGPVGLHDVQARLAARGGLDVLLGALGDGLAGRTMWALLVVQALASLADNPLLAVRAYLLSFQSAT